MFREIIFQVQNILEKSKRDSFVVKSLSEIKETIPREVYDYVDSILIPYDIKITKRNYDDMLQLYFKLKDVESIFTMICQIAYLIGKSYNVERIA